MPSTQTAIEIARVLPQTVLVKGRPVDPPDLPISAVASSPDGLVGDPGDGAVVVRRPVLDRATLRHTGAWDALVFPAITPDDLLEEDPADALLELARLPFDEVLDFVERLRTRLAPGGAGYAAEPGDGAGVAGSFRQIVARLMDPAGFSAAVDRDLGSPDAPGRKYLEGWVRAGFESTAGVTAEMAGRVFDGITSDGPSPGWTRAMPTRQLHITAGNTPIVPVVSILWALMTKGAAVVKAAADAWMGPALLTNAMAAIGPEHPLARHLSVVYWPGGNRQMEDRMFAGQAFDRRIVWGSEETVSSISARGTVRTLVMGPRLSLSLIGRDALKAGIRSVAEHASVDSMIGNQAACNASLVHYVEGSHSDALDYCEELRSALACWDRTVPRALSPAVVGQLRKLRRGAFAQGTWFPNGVWPYLTSTVVYMPTEFDLAVHPGGRCVVVRRVDSLREALPRLSPLVAAVGVAPKEALEQMRDEVAARGVDAILPIGEAGRSHPGMPHDGMRVLSELVRWVTC